MVSRWTISPPVEGLDGIAARWNVPPLVARLLMNRGVSPDEPVDAFLAPQLRDLDLPDRLTGATAAARHVVEAIRQRRKIVLYGDYDVDGIMGVAILWHVLTRAGADVSFYVPHRVEEGYGLHADAMKKLVEEGAELIISVDCGITAQNESAYLNSRGVPLIITDHHAPQETLPDALAIVHPQLDPPSPNPNLCGAGVAFKVAWAIARQFGDGNRVGAEFRDLLAELLPLAALGTIADVVPLVGENRILARHGLERLIQSNNPGLVALRESAGLVGQRISDYDVGFKLAPRINAAGRMGHARLAVELFTRADAARAREIALYLEEHNRSRQTVERRIGKQAVELIERHKLAGDARRAIVLAAEGWHSGVVGIVAARMVDRYHRPAILIALSGAEGQGSGRSIRDFNLGDALSTCGEHLISHGGHAMAAGLRVAADRVSAFAEAFVQVANHRLTATDMIRSLRIDAQAALSELTLPTVESVMRLAPFGTGNPRPRLASGWLELAQEPRCVGSKQEHLSAVFRDNGSTMRAIGFGLGGAIEDLKQHRRCRLAFEPIINEFNGRRSVEMQVVDVAFPAPATAAESPSRSR